MKKICFVLTVALLTAAPALAFDARVGILGGVSLFNFHTTNPAAPPATLENLAWPAGGVFIKISAGAFSIEPEAIYIRMGTRFDVAGIETQYRLDYVQVPLLLKVSLASRARIQPEIFAGPYASTRLAAKLMAGPSGASVTVDVKSQIKSWDWGVIGGLGVNIVVGTVVLSVEGRYCYGIQNINLSLEGLTTGQHAANRGGIVLVTLGF